MFVEDMLAAQDGKKLYFVNCETHSRYNHSQKFNTQSQMKKISLK